MIDTKLYFSQKDLRPLIGLSPFIQVMHPSCAGLFLATATEMTISGIIACTTKEFSRITEAE